jgi:hypothetical protein
MPILPGEEREKFYLPTFEKRQKLDENQQPVFDEAGRPVIEDAPEDERAWVVMDISPARAGDTEILDAIDSDGETGLKGVFLRIREWNFTDASGQRLVIDYDNFKNLPLDDYQYLVRKIKAGKASLTTEEKKSSEPTSAESQTPIQVMVQ